MEKLKNSRGLGLLVIFVVYAIAIAAGVLTFHFLVDTLKWWLSIMVADVAATVVVFVFSLIFRNASVYDAYWSVQPIVIVVAYLFRVETVSPYLIALIVAVLLWGIRLTANWAYTFTGFGYQDWRYVMLKENTNKFYPVINFLGIHLFPTMVVYFCIMPVVLLLEMEATMPAYSLAFTALALLSAVWQGIADCQMHKYRKNRTTPFLRTGVWKHSRHPNYLGEIMMWWGVGLACLVTTGMALVLLGAVINTIMFLCVSIPMADKRQSRKEGFAEYKKQTWALLPFKKPQRKPKKSTA